MKNKRNTIDIEFGMPPQDDKLEEMVLGAIMLEKHALEDIMPIIPNEDIFYKGAHGYIFREIKKLYEKGEPVDILTVTQALKKSGYLDSVGGAYYISGLTSNISSSAHLETHTRLLIEMYLKREQIRICQKGLENGYNNEVDVFEAQNNLENDISGLNRHIIGHEYEGDTAGHARRTMEIIKNPELRKGIGTGNEKLDRVTGGWHKEDLIILGARPSMGKTSRALQFGVEAAKRDVPVALFSLEMGQYPINYKLINHISGVNADSMRHGTCTEEELARMEEATEIIGRLPLYINDKSGINVNYARTICRERKRKYGLEIAIFDYVQLMTPNEHVRGQSQEQIVSGISQGLKKLAKDLKITVIALSQLSRDLESRPSKRPINSDLRHSGQLEQDADGIFFLYRPSKYWSMDKDPDYKNAGFTEEEYKQIVEFVIGKQRMGDAGLRTIEYFDRKTSTFKNQLDGRLELPGDDETKPF